MNILETIVIFPDLMSEMKTESIGAFTANGLRVAAALGEGGWRGGVRRCGVLFPEPRGRIRCGYLDHARCSASLV
ncbi:unnamed protein product, partial [Iphiclides podalirius]